ncbi:MAG: helix-turn-helix domain-containing protein [Balneolales bacterium]
MIKEIAKKPSRREQEVARETSGKINDIAHKHKAKGSVIIQFHGDSTPVEIPLSAFESLGEILNHQARGEAVSIFHSEAEVTTQQAADMLNVSRPYVVKLLDQGAIPFLRVGKHRRIKLGDLEKYKEKLVNERRKHLGELARQAQELDMGY